MKCRKCGSEKVKKYKYNNTSCYLCLKCNYDSCDIEEFSGQRKSQREKGRYNPYKAGGKRRIN